MFFDYVQVSHCSQLAWTQSTCILYIVHRLMQQFVWSCCHLLPQLKKVDKTLENAPNNRHLSVVACCIKTRSTHPPPLLAATTKGLLKVQRRPKSKATASKHLKWWQTAMTKERARRNISNKAMAVDDWECRKGRKSRWERERSKAVICH